jgi:hypothetical protein
VASDLDPFELGEAGGRDDLQGFAGGVGEEMEVEEAGHGLEAHPSVIARSEATKRSRASEAALDCFASLAMTEEITTFSLFRGACG